MNAPKINWALLESAKLVQRPGGAPIPAPAAPAAPKAPPPPPPVVVKRPLPTMIIAPVYPSETYPKRKHALTQQECRDQNICVYCRKAPAKYFGPGIGHAAGCPRCTVENAAANMRRKAAREGRNL